ncbi:PLP-dependent aminotransferase family protein [Vibrio tapetis]|uniref:GntR family transcriptional regulator n=1 Tax=Vibrio tapetis subsp. tapetis TaxID=1671868 RepID=A0A2N8ZJ78_9VIBR|nr:PLP-dependent aminotransferase family protein [Vibrio tapetis]SON51949.1 GntR family transcriptional regulator [Vibrio tapetis subsp. tapetis]
MQLIDIGDLKLSDEKGSRQGKLFNAIRDKIVHNLWPKGGKLPSTRKLATELSLGRNTVTSAYEQLVAEGYLESRQGSGFYVAVELPEHYLPAHSTNKKTVNLASAQDINRPFAPGVPDLAQFPVSKWQKLLQRHASRTVLLGNQDVQGSPELRTALSDYLATSRSVICNPNRIIITSGAQQALSIALMAVMQKNDSVLMEQPGYTQMRKIIDLLGHQLRPVDVTQPFHEQLDTILKSDARALYITPSNQYPMGTSLNIEQRLQLIEWAHSNNRWVIEDDYDSEFQFAHRPYTSLQGLAGQMGRDEHVIYIGSFSKTMFNGMRVGYMVVPESLVSRCLMIKDAITGDSPPHTQAALTDFILEGDLIRHIRKMRRLYKSKHQQMVTSIDTHFGSSVNVISQAAGLHVTLKWTNGINEKLWVERAQAIDIIMRPLRYYELEHGPSREWQSVILGFGNIALKSIDENIKKLADVFHANSE